MIIGVDHIHYPVVNKSTIKSNILWNLDQIINYLSIVNFKDIIPVQKLLSTIKLLFNNTNSVIVSESLSNLSYQFILLIYYLLNAINFYQFTYLKHNLLWILLLLITPDILDML